MYKKTQFIEYEYFQLVNYKVINLSLTLLRASIFVKHSFRKKEILPSSIYHNAVQSAIFIRETSSDSFQNILSITPSPVKRVVCPMQPSWNTKSEYHSVRPFASECTGCHSVNASLRRDADYLSREYTRRTQSHCTDTLSFTGYPQVSKGSFKYVSFMQSLQCPRELLHSPQYTYIPPLEYHESILAYMREHNHTF